VHLLCEAKTVDALEEVARLSAAIAKDDSREALDRAIAALQEFVRIARIEVTGPRAARK
jgi:hypothetical protein